MLVAAKSTSQTSVPRAAPSAIGAKLADQLDARAVRRLSAGSFSVFQLHRTAYPGNSGSPVYHPTSGAVIGIVNRVFVKAPKSPPSPSRAASSTPSRPTS
jgi:serine protease Do